MLTLLWMESTGCVLSQLCLPQTMLGILSTPIKKSKFLYRVMVSWRNLWPPSMRASAVTLMNKWMNNVYSTTNQRNTVQNKWCSVQLNKQNTKAFCSLTGISALQLECTYWRGIYNLQKNFKIIILQAWINWQNTIKRRWCNLKRVSRFNYTITKKVLTNVNATTV